MYVENFSLPIHLTKNLLRVSTRYILLPFSSLRPLFVTREKKIPHSIMSRILVTIGTGTEIQRRENINAFQTVGTHRFKLRVENRGEIF